MAKISGTPVNLDTEKPETGKSATLVDLNARDAEILQRVAWTTFEQVAKNGGYPSVSVPQPPTVKPLPTGLRLTEEDLEGSWAGTILFYPVGPVDIVLRVQRM